jgi:NTE family protein
MARALVLGGGGLVGIAWEAGLVAGLASEGVNLAEAASIVGTSAGSVVGGQLALGIDPVESARRTASDAGAVVPPLDTGGVGGFGGGLEALIEMIMTATTSGGSEEVRAKIGQIALTAPTPTEEEFLPFFSEVKGQPWPKGYSCTAVDTESGEFVVWTAAHGVELDRAIASSCSVPGLFPPVTINGRRYMDGGMRSPLNADVPVGHSEVVVVSVLPASPIAGLENPMLDAMIEQVEKELEVLRSGGARVALIGPNRELIELSGMGLHLMDASRVPAAIDVGMRQGAEAADHVRPVWHRSVS